MLPIKMDGVTEYAENYEVYLQEADPDQHLIPKANAKGRLVIVAHNEGRNNRTEVDLLQLIEWVKKNRPELLA